jgi:hypothetical protein
MASKPPPVSAGHAQLLALGFSYNKIATAIGTAASTVQRWFVHGKSPSAEHRQALAVAFGIAPESFDRPPSAATPEASAAAALAERAEAVAGLESVSEPLPPAPEQLDDLIRQCRDARQGGVSAAVLSRLAALEVRALSERERIRTHVERAFASEEMGAMLDALLRQLNDHPLAMIAAARWGLGGATPERIADWDQRYAAWRERNAALVEAAETANAALRAELPADVKARWF